MRQDWIDDILAVLDSGSLARAAEQRFVTQSAFTRRIRLIEDSIGAPLFDRRRKPVTLLPGVAAMEPDLRDLSARLRRVQSGLKQAATQSGRVLGIVCQHAITTTVSPWIVRALTAQDGIAVRVKSGNQDECLMRLLTGEVDLAILYVMPDEQDPLLSPAFQSRRLGTDTLIPVCAPSVVPNTGNIAGDTKTPIIGYPADVFLGQVFERRIAPRIDAAITTETRAETALTLAAYRFALDGIGIAWVPRSLCADGLAQGRLTALDHLLPAQPLDIRIARLAQGQSEQADMIWTTIIADLALPGG